MSATLITVHFGPFPPAIRLTLESWRRNPEATWLLVTDQAAPAVLPPNVRLRSTSMVEFGRRVGRTLGIDIRLKNPYKICDFKPAYGVIFADELRDAEFWGHCDPDIVLGDLDAFLPRELLAGHDVVSSIGFRLNGPFTLYRNAPHVNDAFRRCPDYRRIFADGTRYFVFDEYMMSPIVEAMAARGELRVHFDGDGMQRHDLHAGLHVWSDGRITELLSGRQAMFFHYSSWKKRWARMAVPPWREGQTWALMPEGLFVIKSDDTSGILEAEYRRSVEHGARPIALNDTWSTRMAGRLQRRLRAIGRRAAARATRAA
jgi:hypothetical protein